mmetsp:Transcript_27297/g.50036  ORF Transcript_27297/g.50036 Transcript_27297/m.50036 type:complete len:209 (+) Transcript_27297:207-833(+)
MKIKTIETEKAFFDDFLGDIMSNSCNEKRNIVYRGQSNESYGLVASVYRPETFEKWKYDQPSFSIDASAHKDQPQNSLGHAAEENRLLRKFVASLHDSNYAILETALSRAPRGTGSLWEFSLWPGETHPIPDYVDLMAIAQHYKIPTRMLDWTRNYLIGLFFAISGKKPMEISLFFHWMLNLYYSTFIPTACIIQTQSSITRMRIAQS